MVGTVGPSVCPNGKLNKRVKKAYTRGAPAMMGLKYSTTRQQLIAAMCSDTQEPDNLGINDQLFAAIDFQAARYDWKKKMAKRVSYQWINSPSQPIGGAGPSCL
jgi:hypothetical protein